MRLERLDENGRAVLGDFRRNALHAGWMKEEVDAVVVEAAMAGDYQDAVRGLSVYVDDPDRKWTGDHTG